MNRLYSISDELGRVRPSWPVMIGTTALASQIAAALFLFGACWYLGSECRLSGAVVAGMW